MADHAAFLPPQPAELDALRQRPDDAPPVLLAGREPTLWPVLGEVLRAARRASLVSNGRVLSVDGRLARLQRAGVQHLLLKRHRLRDADEDSYCAAQGAGAQQRAAMQQAAEARDRLRWTLLVVVVREALGELGALVDEAAAHRAVAVQFTVRAAEVDLTRLEQTRLALQTAAARAEALGLRVGWEGF